MAFHETRFPVDISYGSKGGPGFRTDIVAVGSGAEQRVSRWNQARRSYDVAYGVKTHDQLSTLISFYMARAGAAAGFRYKDFSDFTTAANHRDAPSDTDEVIGTGDGSEQAFQLVKTYTDVVTHTRNVRKPVSGTTVVSIDDVPQASGWSVDTTTGIVTFTVAPAMSEIVKAGCEYDVPVRFGTDIDQALEISYTDFETGDISIPLVEVNDDIAEVQDEYYMGGSTIFDPYSATGSISLGTGRVVVLRPDTASLSLLLQDPTGLPSGAPIWYLVNDSVNGSHAIAVRDHNGVNLFTLSPDEIVVVMLAGSTWYAK